MAVSVKISGVQTVENYQTYVVECSKEGKRWVIKRRYSAFDELRKTVSKECSLSSSFPSKQWGKLSMSQTAKRRDQLETWLGELCAGPLPPLASRALASFVAEPTDPAVPVVVEDATPPHWDESFMSSDPLAAPDEPPPQRPPDDHHDTEPAAATSFADPGPAPVGAAPSFLLATTKTYDVSGEGLRDAVKNGDLSGVRQILGSDPKLATYEDRQRESMLHLAALFNHTEIALALVQAGADPNVQNQNNETPLDLALPSLKSKITKAYAAHPQ
ncbi:hypothetical protein CTAYLR_003469 [Chrysophaeum taylorii]|uniref:PX domain-containing protein n=1 Tax=Chrysophaeum taylorii TaxID=2483200 RepID=A0AAD7UAF4_9STRA|nr:hypothetical protein CTAYLR_003469 [Chrysophaeum taylorii]